METLGWWKRPVTYSSKKLDLVAQGQPAGLQITAAAVLLVKDDNKIIMGRNLLSPPPCYWGDPQESTQVMAVQCYTGPLSGPAVESPSHWIQPSHLATWSVLRCVAWLLYSSGACPEHHAGLDWYTLASTEVSTSQSWMEQLHSEWNQICRGSNSGLGLLFGQLLCRQELQPRKLK